MKDIFLYFYGYLIFFYSMALMLSYVTLMILSYRSLRRNKNPLSDNYVKQIFRHSPYTPGVSIVAPAYNEEKTIIHNVLSLLQQDYPLFEVIIVNDGSTDSTLEKMIEYFELVEMPFVYQARIASKPFKRLFISKNPKYEQLRVVDKENGGTKADAVNGGLNIVRYPYFINTDVDCILSKDAIYRCIRPMIEQNHIIAVSSVMGIANACDVENGVMKKYRIPKSPAALFQTLEYLRSFLIGKMGWSALNAMPNVSGGYGMFDTQIAIAAGGYSSDSLAEDMDILIRMIGYCCDFNLKYRVVQIPDSCCWTEVPSNMSLFNRQRTRWGHGLAQTFSRYQKMIFSRKYKMLGLVTMPYMLIFEFLAPIIEAVGFFVFIYLAVTGKVNWESSVVIFALIFLFCLLLSIVVIYYDYLQNRGKIFPYFRLVAAAMMEPILYHPFVVFFALKGYLRYLFRRKVTWGEMERKGYKNKENENNTEQTSSADTADSTPDVILGSEKNGGEPNSNPDGEENGQQY